MTAGPCCAQHIAVVNSVQEEGRMMRALTLMIVITVLVGLTVATAYAGGSTIFRDARVLGMGLTRVGVPGSSTAVSGNPAALPTLRTFGMNLSPWPMQVGGAATVDTDLNYDRYSLTGAVRNPAGTQGFGFGYQHYNGQYVDSDTYAAACALELCACGLLAGATLYYEQYDVNQMSAEQAGGDDNTWLDIGLMKRFELPLQSWAVGVVARDVTEEFGAGMTFDVGASVELPTDLLIAADIVDVTDEVNSVVNLGAQWPVPLTALTVRAGLADGDFTLGAGYTVMNWEISAAYGDFDWGAETVVSIVGCF